MKRNFRLISKAISLLLALTIIMSVSSTVFAAYEVEKEQKLMLSSEELLGFNSNDMVRQLAGNLGAVALNQLGGGAIVQSVDGFGMSQAMNAVFGGKSDAQLILKANASLTNELNGISNLLAELQAAINKPALNILLNSYQEFLLGYSVMYDRLQAKQNDYANDPEMTNDLLLKIYEGQDANYKIGGDSLLMLTSSLKAKLLEVKGVDGQYCNIFGAIDVLDRYKNKWEHQGYDDRETIRGAAIALYCQFAALTKLACIAKMDDSLSKGDNKAYRYAESDLKQLMKEINEVKIMLERCKIIKHPDLRIFRDTSEGIDLVAFYERVDLAQMRNPKNEDVTSNTFIQCMTTTPHIFSRIQLGKGPERRIEIESAQITEAELLKIYNSYGGKKTLYDIFFGTEEGNFINISNLPKNGTVFTTSKYKYDFTSKKWQYNPINSNGILTQNKSIGTSNRDNHFSVVKYLGFIQQGVLRTSPGQTEEAPVISGMDYSYKLPYSGTVNLSVEEKVGASYQWYVVETGVGEKYDDIPGATTKTYSLPILEPSMNGWMYRCAIIENEGTDEEIFTSANPVTLNLTGEGIPLPVTEHNVSNAEELGATLDKVSDGTWSGHTIKLTADITYLNPITLIENSMTIDLNGHTLTIQPSSDSEPNINPMSNMAETAAIYSLRGNLYVNGEGILNAIAGQGVDYGVYANASEVTVNNIDLTDGGTAVYATDGGSVEITSDVSAKGENTYAVECFGGSTVKVNGNVNTEGHTSCGVYAESYNGEKALVEIGGDIVVSGENSQAAFLNEDYTVLKVQGNITVTGAGASGISAGGGDGENRCTAIIFGDINAPMDAVNAWDNADVRVHGNVTATEEAATAVSVAGALVQLRGNVTSAGKDGTGISASEWDLVDPIVGAMVKCDGKITANTPLRIESMPVEENEHSKESVYAGYYTFTDGTNTVWAKPGSFIKLTDVDPTPNSNSQTGDSLNMVIWFLLGIIAFAMIVMQIISVKNRRYIKL